MASSLPELIYAMPTCEIALRELRREPYLAVDVKGVNLSKTGPLTLLQIGTKDGQVYLFDVLAEPKILETGELKDILESETIVKVMHCCKTAAEALYWQFGVKLHNVFDTQLAHMQLQRAEGRRYPSRMKLAEVCGQYCPQKAALLQEKQEAELRWSRSETDFWAKRPVTNEMIDCASQDVIVLIPEVYEEMERMVKEKDLTSQLTDRTRKDIEATMDKKVKEIIEKEEDDMALAILRDLAKTTTSVNRLSDITDENVLAAIKRLRFDYLNKDGLPQNMRNLKIEFLRTEVEKIKRELDEKGDAIVPGGDMFSYLFISICHSGKSTPLQKLAKETEPRLDKVVLKDIASKYKMETPITHLAEFEKRSLDRSLRPKGENDPTVNPVVLRLYWLQQEEDLDNTEKRFLENPSTFQINPNYVKKIKFFYSNIDVPTRLKTKARNFLEKLHRNGVVARPPRRQHFYCEDEFVYDDNDDDDYW